MLFKHQFLIIFVDTFLQYLESRATDQEQIRVLSLGDINAMCYSDNHSSAMLKYLLLNNDNNSIQVQTMPTGIEMTWAGVTNAGIPGNAHENMYFFFHKE